MLGRPFGIILLAAALLAADLAGIAAVWVAWPRTSNTSPLMALFALVWSAIYIVTGILTWRRSRFAAPAFLGGIGLLLFPARYIVPGGQLTVPSWLSFWSLSSATGIFGRHASSAPINAEQPTGSDVGDANEIGGAALDQFVVGSARDECAITKMSWQFMVSDLIGPCGQLFHPPPLPATALWPQPKAAQAETSIPGVRLWTA